MNRLASFVFILAAAAQAQQINPNSQIRWPVNCNSAGMVYNFNLRTCISAGAGGAANEVQINNGSGGLASIPGFTYSSGANFLNGPSLSIGANFVAGNTVGTGLNGGYMESLSNTAGSGVAANLMACIQGDGFAHACATNASYWNGLTNSASSSVASVYIAGTGSCLFDNTAVVGDFAVTSTTTAGRCHDAGATMPTTGTLVGQVTGAPSAGVAAVYLMHAASGGGGPAVVVVDTVSPVTVSTTASAEFHFNQQSTAGAAIVYNLPTAAPGKQFCFSNSNGGAANTGRISIQTSASGQFVIYVDGTLSASGGYFQSDGAAGDAGCVVGVDATHWMAYIQRNTWSKH